MTTEKGSIKVVVRVRPLINAELQLTQRPNVLVVDKTTLQFDPSYENESSGCHGERKKLGAPTNRLNKAINMAFDRVFDTNVDNFQIFEECTAPLVDKLLSGYNCSVFAYGATGSGKTFTMLGTKTYPGLTLLTIHDLFQKMEQQRDVRKFDVGVSYLEIYNEHIHNLITESPPLQLREGAHGVRVCGLALEPIRTASELMAILMQGNEKRTQHPTDANAESSRSHAVLQVYIRITDRHTNSKQQVKLSMIDLAGSERAHRSRSRGERLKEGANINRSLLALANCITKLSNGKKHIPYRDSNLTRILKDSLGGNCQTLMVANVSMSVDSYEDTYNTLKYASCASTISLSFNQMIGKSLMPKKYFVERCAELEAENKKLKQINETNAQHQDVQQSQDATALADINVSALEPWICKLDVAYARFIEMQQKVAGLQSKIKTLNFRQEMRELNYELYKNMICQNYETVTIMGKDKKNLAEQPTRMPPIVVCNQNVKKLEEDLALHLEELLHAREELNNVKQEAKNSNYTTYLDLYQKYKDSLVHDDSQSSYLDHISVVSLEYVGDCKKLRDTLKKSLEFNQKMYSRAVAVVPDLTDEYIELLSVVKSNHAMYKNNSSNLDEVQQFLELTSLNVTHIDGGFDDYTHEHYDNPSSVTAEPQFTSQDTDSSTHGSGLSTEEGSSRPSEELTSLSNDVSISSVQSGTTFIIKRDSEGGSDTVDSPKSSIVCAKTERAQSEHGSHSSQKENTKVMIKNEDYTKVPKGLAAFHPKKKVSKTPIFR